MQTAFKPRPKDEKEPVLGKREVVLQAKEIACAKALRQGEAWPGLGQSGGHCGWSRVSREEQKMQSEITGASKSPGIWVLF